MSDEPKDNPNYRQAVNNIAALCWFAFMLAFGVSFGVMNAYTPDSLGVMAAVAFVCGAVGFFLTGLVCILIYRRAG